jgi:hypothetical protein
VLGLNRLVLALFFGVRLWPGGFGRVNFGGWVLVSLWPVWIGC